MLKTYGIKNWIAKKRPFLTEEHAKIRLAWAKARVDWTKEEWSKYIWSDECSAERGKGKRREWVFRTPVQKWKKEMIQTYTKGKDISIMVWGAFWGGGKSDLILMERDPEAKKGGYSANSYLRVIEDQLPTIWEPGLTFMQDNASVHTARKVRAWFEEMGIDITDWPPFSPDLNPIEHCWARIKEWVTTHYPHLAEGVSDGEDKKDLLFKALQDAWDALDQDYLDALIVSIETRVNAVIEAKGWYTRF